jgi:hypothetical protein
MKLVMIAADRGWSRIHRITLSSRAEAGGVKAKGRPPLRELAPSSDSSKIWLGFQITTPFAISVR